MITSITGILTHVFDEDARLQVDALEYQILVSEHGRRSLQMRVGEEVTLSTFHYLEGNPTQGRLLPRLVGFVSASEMELFDLFCLVDKVGVRKALKALARPVQDIANAIQREDAKWLTTLPGIGAATAEQMVTKLKRKVTRLSLAAPSDGAATDDAVPATMDGNLIEDAYQGLLSVGLTPMEARTKLDHVLGKKQYTTVEAILEDVFRSSAK